MNSKNFFCCRMQSDSEEFREGAMVAVYTLKRIESLVDECERQAKEGTCIDKQDALVKEALRPLIGLTLRQRGYVTALIQALGTAYRFGAPNLADWKPDAALTEEELKQRLAEMESQT